MIGISRKMPLAQTDMMMVTAREIMAIHMAVL